MKDFIFVDPADLKDLEQYAASLLSGIASLKTLEAYHMEGYKKGLFDEDEEETSKTICWEIRRLISLYQVQLEKIIDRTGFDENIALNYFKQTMPDIKIPTSKSKK